MRLTVVCLVAVVALSGCGGSDHSLGEIELSVSGIAGQPASCTRHGFILLEGDNRDTYECTEPRSSPPKPLGCFVVVDDVVYDLSNRLGRKSC